MSSFGEGSRSIDGVSNVLDYTRRIVSSDELEDINDFKPLLNWWRQINVEKRHLPSRKDFNPAAFKEALPNIAIFEPVLSNEELVNCKIVLIGTELTKVYGETTGELVTQTDNEYVVQTVLDSSRECILRREPLGITSKAVSKELPFMRSYALYCPLASDHIHIDKLLVQVTFENMLK